MKNANKIGLLTMFLLSFCLSSCVQETHLKTVTFKVDMNEQQDVAKVGLRGPFTNPPWGVTISMQDPDGDGIYETTISQKTGQGGVGFKFVNQDSIFELAGKDNRYLRFEYRPQTLLYEGVFDEDAGSQKELKTDENNE